MPKSEAKLSAPKLVDCRLDMHILSLRKNWPLILFSLDFQHKHIYMINNDNNNSNREKKTLQILTCQNARLEVSVRFNESHFFPLCYRSSLPLSSSVFFLFLRNAFFPDVVVASGGYILLCFGFLPGKCSVNLTPCNMYMDVYVVLSPRVVLQEQRTCEKFEWKLVS